MGLKIFITGTSGYLGSVLATQLSSVPEVESITGIDNNPPHSPLPFKVNFIQMDIRSPDMPDAVRGHDYIIHTACIVQWPAKMPKKVRDDINFNGTRNMANAALKNKVRGFLQASSCAAYDLFQVQGRDNITEDCPIGKGNAPFYYWNTKSTCEKILNDTLGSSDVTLTLLRMGTIIGPSSPITLLDLRRDAIRIPGLDPRVQYIHENDVVQAFLLAIRKPMPGAYNVVPDDFVRMSKFHEIIGASPVTTSLWLAKLVSFIRWRYFGSIIHPSWITSYRTDFTLSNAKLKSMGWKPEFNSEQAVRSVCK